MLMKGLQRPCVLLLWHTEMKSSLSVSAFFIVLSLILLGVLEYLWLRNEYRSQYREMEDELTQMMFSTMRDAEDSIIFSSLADPVDPFHSNERIPNSDTKDTVLNQADSRTQFMRFPVRGMLLKKIQNSEATCAPPSIDNMIMNQIKATDSTGACKGYCIVTWQEGDTCLEGIASKPAYDVLGDQKMALQNTRYKADLLEGMIPHFGFALVLWIMVATAFYYIWQSLKRQIRLNELRDELVGNITHELKTPITTLGVALESMTHTKSAQDLQSRTYMEICKAELSRLNSLVERILHSSSPALQYEKVDVQKVAEDVMQHMKIQFEKRNAQVELQTDGDQFIIKGDKTHMTGVVYNLLENALKYSPSCPEITLRLGKKQGNVVLEIEDHGIGIHPDYHDKVFDKLFRVPQQNRHDVKGHGLGLSYVADVVKKHEGSVHISSQPGIGSIFSLSIPSIHEN